MKTFHIAFVSIFIVLIVKVNAIAQHSTCEKAQQVLVQLEKYHCCYTDINDSTSSYVFDYVFLSLDEYKMFFLKEDSLHFEQYRYTIDDQIKSGSCTFLDEVTNRYVQRVQECETLQDSILKLSIEFENEAYFQSGHKSSFPLSNLERGDKWQHLLKYMLLDQLVYVDSMGNASDTALYALNGEQELRNQWLTDMNCMNVFGISTTKGLKELVSSAYLNGLTSSIDPHSSFFTMEQNKLFNESMSKEKKSFGITFEKGKNVPWVVQDVELDGAAYRSEEIEVGDVLLGISDVGNQPVDIRCKSADEINTLLNNETFPSETIRLVLKDKFGEKKTVTLVKRLTKFEAQSIRTYVLNGTDFKIGYIVLPSFYSDWDEKDSVEISKCAVDVESAVLKLKEEKIDGLIVDLRYNGGGSVNQAVDMASLFIEEGPFLMGCPKNEEETFVYQNTYLGRVYDGPLLLMVNYQSASASEMLAGTLQEYNRAIIVGTQTFGKSTSQGIFPLYEDSEGEDHGSDFVKITMFKVYQSSGKSYQYEGVQPDVTWPDFFAHVYKGEREYSNAYAKSFLNKRQYYFKERQLPLSYLRSKSKKRLESHAVFTQIDSLIADSDDLEKEVEEKIPLEKNAFLKRKERMGQVKHRIKEVHRFTTSLYKAEKAIVETNEKEEPSLFESRELKRILHDPELEESFRILKDYRKLVP